MFPIRKIFPLFFLISFLMPLNNAFSAESISFKSGDWVWSEGEFGGRQTSLAEENRSPFDVGGDLVYLNISLRNIKEENEINKIFKLQFSNTSDFGGEVSYVSASSTCETASVWCYGGEDGYIVDHLRSATTTLSFLLKNVEKDYKKTVYFFRLYDSSDGKTIDLDTGKTYPSIVSRGSVLSFNIDDFHTSSYSTDGGVPSLVFNLNLNRGEKWQSQIVLVNKNKKDISLELKTKDFEEKGSSFSMVVKKDGDNLKEYFSSKWLKISAEKIIIKKNSRIVVPFTIEIPLSAEPGDYFLGIIPNVFFENAGISESSIELSPSLVSLSIKGNTKERGRVNDFSIKNIVNYNPSIDFDLKFENFGDVHLSPVGWLKIYDFWGNELNIDNQYSSIKFDAISSGEISDKVFNLNLGGSSPGYYYAALSILYGDTDKQKIEKTINFFVVPPDFWTNVGLLLVGIFLFFKFGIPFVLNKDRKVSSRKIKIN